MKHVFADPHYLQNWKSDLNFGEHDPESPVTHVSWFAATAYCESLGEELPSSSQWEYAAAGSNNDRGSMTQKILDWYSEPTPKRLRKVGRDAPNSYGVHDMFGLVWEWTSDFNENSLTKDAGLTCGAGGAAATDPADYATFMRYSFRSSLNAAYSISNLGFRCARSSK